jgi:hypothetical protein
MSIRISILQPRRAKTGILAGVLVKGWAGSQPLTRTAAPRPPLRPRLHSRRRSNPRPPALKSSRAATTEPPPATAGGVPYPFFSSPPRAGTVIILTCISRFVVFGKKIARGGLRAAPPHTLHAAPPLRWRGLAPPPAPRRRSASRPSFFSREMAQRHFTLPGLDWSSQAGWLPPN